MEAQHPIQVLAEALRVAREKHHALHLKAEANLEDKAAADAVHNSAYEVATLERGLIVAKGGGYYV